MTHLNGFSPNLICAFILWRSGLGLLLGTFRQYELSPHNMKIAGYYHTFLLVYICAFTF